MCLILFALQQHPDYPLIVAANRDEFFARDALAAHYWDDTNIYAGRDLSAGGTWLGVNKQGAFAALTNFREPGSIHPEQKLISRGELAVNFLNPGQAINQEHYSDQLQRDRANYNGYNLLFGTPDKFSYFSNRGQLEAQLNPQIYGLSNDLIDTPWPKVTTGKQALADIIHRPQLSNELLVSELFTMLNNAEQAPDHQLPDTGVGLEWERTLSPRFILGSDYGTRTSTVVLFHRNGTVEFHEHNFDSTGQKVTQSMQLLTPQ